MTRRRHVVTPVEVVEACLRHRRATQEVARLMPDEHYDDEPWEGGRSFGELVLHIVDSTDAMLGAAPGQATSAAAAGSAQPPERPATPSTIRAYLDAKTGAKGQLMLLARLAGVRDRMFYVAT